MSEVEMNSATALHGSDIAKVLKAPGPVVKCVLLKSSATSGNNGETEAVADNNAKNDAERRILTDLIEEVEIDTTPSKNMVSKTLGGPFTFLGQYEEEGVVLMIRNLPEPLIEESLKSMKASELLFLCREREIDRTNIVEKAELIDHLLAYERRQLPINPHFLQPPLHQSEPRGDILVLKVAETNEELDTDHPENALNEINVPSNDEFFLDYTRQQWIDFASRPPVEEEEEEDEGVEDKEEEEEEEEREQEDDYPEEGVASVDNDEEYKLGEDEQLEEEDKSAMFNLVMNEVLRQYREENGRGPNTQELLELRSTIAKELDVQVNHVDPDAADWDKKAKANSKNSEKKIGFHLEDSIVEYTPDPNEHSHLYELEELDEDEEGEGGETPVPDETPEPPNKRLKLDNAVSPDEEHRKHPPKETNFQTDAAQGSTPVSNGHGHSPSEAGTHS